MAIKVAMSPADIERRIAASHASPERLAQFRDRMRHKAMSAQSLASVGSGDGGGAVRMALTHEGARLGLGPLSTHLLPEIREKSPWRRFPIDGAERALPKYDAAVRAAETLQKAQPFSAVTPQHLDALTRHSKLRGQVQTLKDEAFKLEGQRDTAQRATQRAERMAEPLPSSPESVRDYAPALVAGAGGVGLGLVGGMLGAKALGKKRETEGA